MVDRSLREPRRGRAPLGPARHRLQSPGDDGTLGLLLLLSTYAIIGSSSSVPFRGNDTVTALQAIVLGMMLGWTPAMVLFAYFLWRDTGPLSVQKWDRDGIVPESALNP